MLSATQKRGELVLHCVLSVLFALVFLFLLLFCFYSGASFTTNPSPLRKMLSATQKRGELILQCLLSVLFALVF
jgi:ABC-type thiamin/hydroxymethylpyrimidine transport system permease subunit